MSDLTGGSDWQNDSHRTGQVGTNAYKPLVMSEIATERTVDV